MAFFNHWSSERLSFSLSVVAVISAAITSYHQFYEHSFTQITPVEVRLLKDHSNSAESSLGILEIRLLVMNGGTTPCTIISEELYLTADPLFSKAESHLSYGYDIQMPEESVTAFAPRECLQTIMVEPESSRFLTLKWTLKHSDVEKCLLSNRAPSSDSNKRDFSLVGGLNLEAIDPFGHSSEVQYNGLFLGLDLSDSLNWRPLYAANSNGIFAFENFEPIRPYQTP